MEIELLNSMPSSLMKNQEYADMVLHINSSMPDIRRSSQNFYKSSSQYKNVTLDITNLTPINSMMHILAVIDLTRKAIEHGQANFRRNTVKLNQKQEQFDSMEPGYDKDLIEIDIFELNNDMSNAENNLKGAVRKLSFFVTQYNSIVEKLGKKYITEEDYELDESKYHIMTALKQAMLSARARGGLIDEGNHIYLFELGMNGASIQKELTEYFLLEQKMLNKGENPTHEMSMNWIEDMAEKHKTQGIEFAQRRGLLPLDYVSLVKELEA